MYDIERYVQAETAEDAIRLLSEDPKAVLISGGSDVLIQIREGRYAGCSLVSIHGIKELEGITLAGNGDLQIGPATVFSHITNNPLIQERIPVLGEAVDQVGGPQIRNIGTIGGNICNGVTSADSASTLMAFDAVLTLRGPEGDREVSIHDFYTGPGRTVREHAELLVRITIPKESYSGMAGHYIKYGKREAMEIATLGCSVNVRLSNDRKTLENIRISYGVAGPVPLRCWETEAKLKGRKITQKLVEELGKNVLLEAHPRSSWRASKEFRLQLVEELAKRAFVKAVVKGGGCVEM